MNFINFLQVFGLLIIFGTLCVTGWYFITRGEKEIMPDNTIKTTGKVFKGWYFFWTKTKGVEVLYYTGEQLEQLYKQYLIEFPDDPFKMQIDGSSFVANVELDAKEYKKMKEKLETALQVKVLLKGKVFSFYQQFDKYVFPWWVRDPVAVCATCFASVYGSAFYWLAIYLPKVNLFAWAFHEMIAKVCFWIAFCFALAVLNTALAKKFN